MASNDRDLEIQPKLETEITSAEILAEGARVFVEGSDEMGLKNRLEYRGVDETGQDYFGNVAKDIAGKVNRGILEEETEANIFSKVQKRARKFRVDPAEKLEEKFPDSYLLLLMGRYLEDNPDWGYKVAYANGTGVYDAKVAEAVTKLVASGKETAAKLEIEEIRQMFDEVCDIFVKEEIEAYYLQFLDVRLEETKKVFQEKVREKRTEDNIRQALVQREELKRDNPYSQVQPVYQLILKKALLKHFDVHNVGKPVEYVDFPPDGPVETNVFLTHKDYPISFLEFRVGSGEEEVARYYPGVTEREGVPETPGDFILMSSDKTVVGKLKQTPFRTFIEEMLKKERE